MLYMHTAKGDLTARARIRDAALLAFATHGFQVPLRQIAQDAGVSVALITHHFGTKDALRQECDDLVLDRYEDMKLGVVADPSTLDRELADLSDASVLTVYMVQCFLSPSPVTTAFFDRFLERARKVMEASLAAGLVRPEVMDERTLRLLAVQSVGHIVVAYALNPPADPRRFVEDAYTLANTAALLDLYRGGIFTDSPAFDHYMAALKAKIGDDGHA
jgi:AcrR family transcriptional regulator